jgi:hypothetical protein
VLENKYATAVEQFKKALEYTPNNEQILSYIEKYQGMVGGRMRRRRRTHKKHKKSKRMTRRTK